MSTCNYRALSLPPVLAFDAIVIGLGAIGSATAYQLAKRGARVLGIDRYEPPHNMGSSHGHSRITRLAVGEGPEYVPLVQRSHAIWRELESQGAGELMQQTGGLVLGAAEGGGAMHGQADFVGRSIEVAQDFGIAHEVWDVAGITARYPQFVLSGDERGLFEPTAGVLRPERCVAAQLAAARRLGAQLITGQAVTALAADGDGVRVNTASGTWHGAHAVLCAGAWNPALAEGRFVEKLSVHRQLLHWFVPEEPAWYAPGRCPVFIWAHGPGLDDAFYGIPMIDGLAGVKVGSAQYAKSTDPDALEHEVSAAESAAMHARHVSGRLRGVSATRAHAAACLYTVAPGSRFVVDRHPHIEQVTVVSACSGHGFKHSAALGEALAEQLLTGASTIDLSPFAWQT